MSKLVRTLAGYAGCSADVIASGSKAQVMYFINDAKADIATLAAALELVIQYDVLLHRYEGPQEVLYAQDAPAIDAAYDFMIATARAAISTPSPAVVSVTAEGK